MKRWQRSGRLALVVTFVVLVLAGCGVGRPGAEQGPPGAGGNTLAFSATTLQGAAFDGAALAGRPVVAWFWAPF